MAIDIPRVQGAIRNAYGTDLYRTPGKAPVMNHEALVKLRALHDQGHVVLDESEAPIMLIGGKAAIGHAFVSVPEGV
ncbi:hypothetical protein [Roseococcus microcysteis]|uniref:hypothetical protein n=1 Tax=Roseococcus microcysteis TaxID=2771361 RepID=UPI00168BCB2B|nr:hypothetical protein [Roseococcus microcysteis]